jgi:hypothetical protein
VPNVGSNLSRFRHWAKGLLSATTTRKAIQITVETDHVLIIRRMRSWRAWCPECGGKVEMVGLESLMTADGRSVEISPARLQAQGCHLAKNLDGSFLVCVTSLRLTQGSTGSLFENEKSTQKIQEDL